MSNGGHVFVIDGNVSKLACDAWLLPTDEYFSITSSFCEAVGMKSAGTLPGAPADWGGQGCLLLEKLQAKGRPDLWLGDVGRQGAPLQHYAQRAVEFIERACVQLRTQRSTWDRPPLLAMNVIGSGHGGKRSDRGGLLDVLLPAIHEAARAQGCDVALVTYGPVMYAAAQSARRAKESSLRPWDELSQPLREAGDALASHAKAGNLVVFLGAGVSVAAGVPAWQQLLQQIGKDLGVPDADLEAMKHLDPRDQATVLQRLHPAGFDAAVHRAVTSERPSLLHGLLASLPAKEFVTTNFDTLFEAAATTAGRPLAVLPGDPVSAGARWLLKLHGTLGKDLVLTRGDYLGASSRHVALRGLVQALLMTRHMLFVGYSLSDEDFHQLVHEVRSALKQDHTTFGTALMPLPHTFMQQLWDDMTIVDTSRPDDDTNADDEGNRTFQQAARRLAIMLDYVGSRAVSDVQFVADDSLGTLRTEEETELAEIIGSLDALLRRHRQLHENSTAWPEVQQFLKLFKPSKD